MDSTADVYRPLIEKEWGLLFYFVCIILVVPLVVMNLVTAVIVNDALEQALQDKEAVSLRESRHRKKMVRDLKKIFMNLDGDGSGNVTQEEILNIGELDRAELKRLTNMSDPTD